MSVENLTHEQRVQVACEEFEKHPKETICTLALAHMGGEAISNNVTIVEMENTINVDGKNYKVKLTAKVEKY